MVIRSFIQWLVVAAGLAMGNTQGATMKLEIALAKPSFAVGETIAASVSITNDTDASVAIPRPHSNRNWQPTYTIAGPAYPEGKTFSFGSAVWKGGAPSPAEMDTTTLGPGESKREDVPLDQLVELFEPGAYTLKADLVWNGATSHAAPVSFAIERGAIRSCQLLATPGLGSSAIFPAFCLQRPASGPGEIQVAIFKLDQQLGTLARTSLSRHSVPGEGAEAVFVPWLGYSQDPGKPSPRPIVLAGSRLGILAFKETGGGGITLPFTPHVVRPALGVARGDQDLFVVDNLGTRLALVRFPGKSASGNAAAAPTEPAPPLTETKTDAQAKPPLRKSLPKQAGASRPRLLWTMSLPAKVVSGRAALAAPGGGESRHAILVADDPAGTRLLLADAGDGSKIAGVHTFNLPGLHVRRNSEPGLHVDAKGRARAAVILESAPRPDGSIELSLVEVTWEARRAEPRVESVPLTTLATAPRAAAATYAVSAGKALRAWAVVTADGEVLSSSPPGTRRLKGTPTLPLDLLATDSFLALLTLGPTGAPELERL